MSLTYIVGNPGSGKTYFAVNKLYESFIFEKEPSLFDKIGDKKEKSKNYEFAYTNINEFDFTKSDKIKKLEVDIFKYHLAELYGLYQSKATDKELIKKAKELKLCNVLIVIDECHSTIFNKKGDKILIWWLTYHRHLYQDIYLITQNLSLVASEYKKIAEFFYKAVDGSKRLFSKKFRYVLFNSPTMYQKRDIVPGGGISLNFNSEVFKLYHSGNSTNHKSYLKIYFLISLILIIFTSFLVSKFKSYFSNDNEIPKTEISQNLPKIQTSTNSVPKIDNNISKITNFYKIQCFSNVCTIKDYEKFSYTLFRKMIVENPPLHYEFKELSKGITEVYLYTDKPVFEFLKKEVKNEKDSNSFSLSNGFIK